MKTKYLFCLVLVTVAYFSIAALLSPFTQTLVGA